MPDSASLQRIKSCADTGTSCTAVRLPSTAVPTEKTAADHTAFARRVYDCAHITGTFTLRSGAVSHEYVDKYLFEADPPLLRDISEAMAPSVPNGTDALAGLGPGD